MLLEGSGLRNWMRKMEREMLSVVVGDERDVMGRDCDEQGIDVLAVRNALASV